MTGTVERACTVTPRHRHKGKASEKNDPGAPAFPRAEEPSESPSHLPSALPSLTVSSLSPLRVCALGFPHPSASVLRGGGKAGQKWDHCKKLKCPFFKSYSNNCEVVFKQGISPSVFFFKVFHLRSYMTEYISQSPSWPCNSAPKWVWVESHCLECPEWGPECGSRFQHPGCLNSLIVTLLELRYWERCCQTKDGPSFPQTHIQPNSKSCLLCSSSF